MNTPVESVWADFSDTLRRFILKRVGDVQVSEDILQDVFVKIHAGIADLKDERRLQAWVYQITRNAIVDYYRKPQRGQQLLEELAAQANDEEREVERQLSRSLKGMVEQLPEEYRQALILTAFEGMTQKEAAARLGLSLSGAKSRVQRAREKLRDMLLECCHFEFDRQGKVIDYYPRKGSSLAHCRAGDDALGETGRGSRPPAGRRVNCCAHCAEGC